MNEERPVNAVWVQRTYSPALAALVPLVLLGLRRQRRNLHPGHLLRDLAALVAVLALGTVRVVINQDGLRVGFGPWGWPERRFPLSRITEATVDPGVSLRREDLRAESMQLARRLLIGLGYRLVPNGTRVVLDLGDILVVRLDSGLTFGVTVPDATRAADLINSQITVRRSA
jgi:hypothetical protein